MADKKEKKAESSAPRDWFATLVDKVVIQNLSYLFKEGKYASSLAGVENPVMAQIIKWASSGPGRIGVDFLMDELTKRYPVISKASGEVRNVLEDIKIEIDKNEKGSGGTPATSDTSKLVNAGINKILAIGNEPVRQALLQKIFSLPSEEIPVALQIFSTFDRKSLERTAKLQEPMWLNFEAQLIKPRVQKKKEPLDGKELQKVFDRLESLYWSSMDAMDDRHAEMEVRRSEKRRQIEELHDEWCAQKRSLLKIAAYAGLGTLGFCVLIIIVMALAGKI